MIRSIELINFQSHKKTSLSFSEGINSIIGSSDKGKTSILRSLYWTIFNRPSGDSFVSHWAKNDKKQLEECSVNINNELIRKRDKDFNGYILNGQSFKALKSDVPEEIKTYLNISEVNIQKQLDKPFLLGETSGEIARFFNRIIKLDEIDKILSLTESKKRETKRIIENHFLDKEDLEKKYKSFEGLELIGELINKLDKLFKKISRKENQIKELTEYIDSYKSLNNKIKKYIILIDLEKNVKEWESLVNKISVLKKEKNDLFYLSKELNVHNKILIHTKSLPEIEKKFTQIRSLSKDLKEKKIKINNLDSLIEKYYDSQSIIESSVKIIKKCEEKLPEICPICNGTGRLK
ncbi:MAG: hypothetical protein ACFFDN_02035 [Candidatus Hodarchaeota archaeon]